MICTTCGRDNPGHLIFCQECGQRLAPRVATPTPPTRLSPLAPIVRRPERSPLARSAPGPLREQASPSALAGGFPPPENASSASSVPALPLPSERTALPLAEPATPEERWPKRVGAPPENPTLPSRDARPPPGDGAFTSAVASAAAPHAQADARPGEKQPTVACLLCGSSNERGLRYCVTCGHLLAQAETAPAIRVGTGTVNFNRPAAEPARPHASGSASALALSEPRAVEPAPLLDAAIDEAKPIAPARVVAVGGPARETAPALCPRCRGASDPNAQYCRFCGSALGAPTPAAHATARARSGEANRVDDDEPASHGAIALDDAWTAVAASDSAARLPAGLVLIARDGGEGSRFSLGASTDVGRAEGDIVLAEDRYMSPRHARIVSRGGGYFIRDLESTNGIFFRIPFVRSLPPSSTEDGDFPSLAEAGQTSGQTAHDPVRLDPGSEHPLADQELFLIGQQVLRFEVVKHANAGFGVASESGTLLFGTPAAPRFGRLSQRTVEGVVRDVFYLRKAETVIGRESGDVVFTDDPFVSRRHAVLRMHEAAAAGVGRRFTLADLGSSNGTFVQVRDEVRLRHGDQFRIGQQLFRFDHDVTVTGA